MSITDVRSTKHLSTSSHKAWAREHLRGVETTLRPSFSPDFTALDADGIRHDVRQAIAQGFTSVFCSPAGLTIPERKQFLEVAVDEAGGRLGICAVVADLDFADVADLLAHAERTGATHTFVRVPNRAGDTEDALFDAYARILTSTSLPAVLFVTSKASFTHLHPSGIPLGLMRRVAELPNAVAVKLTQTLSPGAAVACCDALADRLVINTADFGIVPALAKAYPIQWMGQWNVEAVQSPAAQNVVAFVDHLVAGRFDAALAIYWKIYPAFRAFADLQRSFLLRGSHPWTHLKYYQWCVGGNGGLYRVVDETEGAILDEAGRKTIRDAYASMGLHITEQPEDEFLVGVSNYRKGVRASDLPERPCYR